MAWPDVVDVKRVLNTFPEPTPAAVDIWPDVYLATKFLVQVIPYCADGEREFNFVPVSQLQSFVESFVERPINELAVRVAVRMYGTLKFKRSKSDSSMLLVKVPPLHKFEEARDQWKDLHQPEYEKAIEAERIEMAQWKRRYGKEMWEYPE